MRGTKQNIYNTGLSSNIISVFMLLVLLTAPLFHRSGFWDFYSVELSYFACSAVLMYLVMIWCFVRRINFFVYDKAYRLFLCFFLLGLLSLIDTYSMTRGFIFIGQYIPYIFTTVLIINITDSKEQLAKLINSFVYISLLFVLLTIISGVYYDDRNKLNFFLLNYFNISVNKVITYIELPLCILAARFMIDKRKRLSLILLPIFILGILVTGSRGSYIVLFNIFMLSILITKKVGKGFIILLSLLVFLFLIFNLGLIISPVERAVNKMNIYDDDNEVAFSRLYTMKVALQTLADHPINGVGIGNLSYFAGESMKKLYIPSKILVYWEKKNLFETSNTPLKLGSEMGIGGILFFFVFYHHIWRKISKDMDMNSEEDRTTVFGMKIFVISSFLHNFVDLGFTNYYTWLYYGAVFAASHIFATDSRLSEARLDT